MVEQRFKLGTANAINEYGNFPILDNDKGLSLIEAINILNEYDAVFKSIDRLTDEGGEAIEYDTPNAAYYVFYHRVSGFQRYISPNVILGTIKGSHKKIDEQQATIDKLEQRDYYNQSERYKILGRAIELTANYIANSDEEHYDFCALVTEFEKELLGDE